MYMIYWGLEHPDGVDEEAVEGPEGSSEVQGGGHSEDEEGSEVHQHGGGEGSCCVVMINKMELKESQLEAMRLHTLLDQAMRNQAIS